MQFIGLLSTSDRERLMAESDVVQVGAGKHLLRRGGQGGDIFLVETGRLEVVDSRQNPEMVLDILGPGRVVGEMAFVDQALRAADVRVIEDCTVRHWNREDLLRTLDSDPGLSSRFYMALSAAAVARLRATDQLAATVGQGQAVRGVTAAVADEAREIATGPRSAWAAAEEELRLETPGKAASGIEGALGGLVEAVDTWLSAVTSVGQAREAGGILRAELRHWLVRSRSGQLGIERRYEQGARLSFLAHILLNRAEGSDKIGEGLDASILNLPTARALRRRMAGAVEEITASLPQARPAVVTLLQPSCGALLARIIPKIVIHGGVVRCVDADSQALAFVDAGLQARPTNVSLEMVHQDLVALCEERATLALEPSDVIVLNGLIDHLPVRLVGSLLRWCRDQLAPGGRLVLTAMGPTPDARFMEHLLHWPLMRRTAEELLGLCEAAGLQAEVSDRSPGLDDGGIVIVSSRARSH